MTHTDILKDLKKGIYKPIYFLHGEEAYFIDMVSDYIEDHVLSEGEKGFNQTILYGKESNFQLVVDNASRYPMMSQYQVVIVKEAQEMRDLEDLIKYVEKPLSSTVLVICYKHKAYKKFTSKFGKALKEHAVILEAKPLYDNQIADWVKDYLKKGKLLPEPETSHLIAEYLGTDLSKISNELDKLILNLEPGSTITAADVEKHIGISKDYNIFEFQKAIAAREIQKSNRIANYFIANEKKNPLVMIISSLTGFFTKVYQLHHLKGQGQEMILKTLGLRSAWFLKDYQVAAKTYNLHRTELIIATLKEYDLKSKGVDFNATNAPDGALLKELLWKILHPG
ncbi:MAG: DNA polymerase III subunit delta [Saprospiraceae bacterium]|nr:DNA polymerase III subunit delta [Saprospiraceae bacterium]